MESKTTKNIIIGCTGSVASIKIPELVEMFLASDTPSFQVKIVATEHAKHFFKQDELPAGVSLLNDQDDWLVWEKRGDPVVHIELSKWADILLVAPLDANTLAKIANVGGILIS